MSLLTTSDAALAPVENPDVKSKVQEVLDTLRSYGTELEGLFSTTYASLPPLGGEEKTSDEEMVKSFLANSTSGRAQLKV